MHLKAGRLNLTGRRQTYPVNKAFFDLPPTAPARFVGGFWFSDGSATPTRISFCQKSPTVLEYIRTLMSSTQPIYYDTRKHLYTLQVNSRRLVTALAQWCDFPMNRKSWGATYPAILGGDDQSFIRGVFEGDGCIFLNTGSNSLGWQITGTHDFLAAIQQRLVEHCNVGRTKLYQDPNSSTTCVLVYNGNLQVPRIMDWLYPPGQVENSSIFLAGKHGRYQELCAQTAGTGVLV